MKKNLIIICFVLIIFSFFIKIPNYVELNNLVIVESIWVDCSNNKIYLKEIIPIKDNNGINYKYKLYDGESINEIEKNISKKIFYKDTKYLISNCESTRNIINYFKINPTYIKHVKNIKEELD